MKKLNYLSSYSFIIIGTLAFALAILPTIITNNLQWLLVFPPIFIIAYPLVAIALVYKSKKFIKRGKFPRDPLHHIYGHRKMFGACWTSVYYFKGLYHILLSIPLLKKILFRGFGYKGDMNFIVYPDSWIRDLPILNFGKKVYISNRSTLGTNICLSDGTIFVDKITLEDGALIGHLCMLAPGVKISKKAEIGVGTAIGMRSFVGTNSFVNAESVVSHGVSISENVNIGLGCFLGQQTRIAPNLNIPSFTVIPDGIDIRNEDDLKEFIRIGQQKIKKAKDDLTNKIKNASIATGDANAYAYASIKEEN